MDTSYPMSSFSEESNNFTSEGQMIKSHMWELINREGNNTFDLESDLPYPDFSQIQIVRQAFLILFLVEFVVSVTGNLLVCLTVFRNKSMHSHVNYYIANLGICDFLIGAFVLPAKLYELTTEANVNKLNDVWCTALRFIETVFIFVSVFTLVAICIERYYAIVYPMESRVHMTDCRIRRVLTFVWVFPIIVASPNLYPAQAVEHKLFSEFGGFTRLTCFDMFSDEFRMWYFFFLFLFMYIVPLLIIGTTCFSITKALMRKVIIEPCRDSRAVTIELGRRKVAKMVLVVVFTFILCWSPYFVVTIITQIQTENFLHQGHFFFTMLSINLLCFTNSCVNPIVYFSMSDRFRRGVMCLLRSMKLCPRGAADAEKRTITLRQAIVRRRAIRRPLTNFSYSQNEGAIVVMRCSIDTDVA